MSRHSSLCACGNRPSVDDGAEPYAETMAPRTCEICGCERPARVSLPFGSGQLLTCLQCYARGQAIAALMGLGMTGVQGVQLDQERGEPACGHTAPDSLVPGPCVRPVGHDGGHIHSGES